MSFVAVCHQCRERWTDFASFAVAAEWASAHNTLHEHVAFVRPTAFSDRQPGEMIVASLTEPFIPSDAIEYGAKMRYEETRPSITETWEKIEPGQRWFWRCVALTQMGLDPGIFLMPAPEEA